MANFVLSPVPSLVLGTISGLMLAVPLSSPASPPAVAATQPAASTLSSARPAVQLSSQSLARSSSRSRPSPPRRPAPPRHRPPNRTQPGGGLDAATQACDPANSPLTAIVPTANPVYTTTAHPTFLFHMPDTAASLERAEFILLSSDEKEAIHTMEFVPTRPGIVSVSLPTDTTSGLTVGQGYRWYLNVYCQDANHVLSVDGWVERVTALDSNDSTLTEAGLPVIWYDAIARTAEILAIEENTQQRLIAQQQWTQWLERIGIGDIASVPVVGPVVPLSAAQVDVAPATNAPPVGS